MLIFRTNLKLINSVKKFLLSHFYMKDLGKVNVILGTKVIRKDDDFILSQSHYIEKVLKKF